MANNFVYATNNFVTRPPPVTFHGFGAGTRFVVPYFLNSATAEEIAECLGVAALGRHCTSDVLKKRIAKVKWIERTITQNQQAAGRINPCK